MNPRHFILISPLTHILCQFWQNKTVLFCRERYFLYLCGEIRRLKYGKNHRKTEGDFTTVQLAKFISLPSPCKSVSNICIPRISN